MFVQPFRYNMCVWQTDSRTDGLRAIAYAALGTYVAHASRGKKNCSKQTKRFYYWHRQCKHVWAGLTGEMLRIKWRLFRARSRSIASVCSQCTVSDELSCTRVASFNSSVTSFISSATNTSETYDVGNNKTTNQACSEYKHTLTFRVRRYVVLATKPVHRLHIRPILPN